MGPSRFGWVLTAAVVGCCLSIASAELSAGETVLLKDVKLEDTTLLPAINALGPIPANGTWQQDGAAIAAVADPAVPRAWTIRTAGDDGWTDYELKATVTIRKPGPVTDKRLLCHPEFDRYLPRESFPPLCQHTGQYRYRYYAGEFDWGSEACVFVRYQDREHCYRVQLSTEYQEIILWHGLGGYLQVVPCKLEAGRAYKVRVSVRGKNIQVALDGEKKIDYWHRTLPTLRGKIGLGAYRSTVAFQDVTATALPPADVDLPPHQARLRTGLWRTMRFIFDGYEPICLVERSKHVHAESSTYQCMYYSHIKLVPGYRAYMNGWIGMLADGGVSRMLTDEHGVKTRGENSGELVLEFDSVSPKGAYRVNTTDRVTFDRLRGTYRHDVTDALEFVKDVTLPELQFFDPLTFNNKEPGRGVKHRWLPAGHDWGIIRGEDGKLYHHPNTQGFYGNSRWKLSVGKSLWMLYPDRAGCPAFEYDVPGAKFQNAICHWGYDWHQSVVYGRPGRAFKKGEKVVIRHAFTAYPPREAERMFAQSTLHPVHLAKNWQPPRKTNMFSYCDPHAYPICDPSGTDFTRVYNTRIPSVGFQFAGRYKLDNTVGRNDTYSLRLDGPNEVMATIYHHMLDMHAKRYLCTVWLKTQGVTGKGPRLILGKYFGNEKSQRDTVVTALTGDNDWQKISFTTTVISATQQNYDGSDVVLTLDGKGQVWMDDFSIRPIEEGETVQEVLPTGAVINRVARPPFFEFWKSKKWLPPSWPEAKKLSQN